MPGPTPADGYTLPWPTIDDTAIPKKGTHSVRPSNHSLSTHVISEDRAGAAPPLDRGAPADATSTGIGSTCTPDPDLPLAAQDPDQLLWKIYKGPDQRGHGTRHVVHGHHHFRDGPSTIEGRTNLDTQAWYTGQRGRRHQGPAAERRLRRHCQPCGECPTVSTASKNKWPRPQRV